LAIEVSDGDGRFADVAGTFDRYPGERQTGLVDDPAVNRSGFLGQSGNSPDHQKDGQWSTPNSYSFSNFHRLIRSPHYSFPGPTYDAV
jgi:hypothetical protein